MSFCCYGSFSKTWRTRLLVIVSSRRKLLIAQFFSRISGSIRLSRLKWRLLSVQNLVPMHWVNWWRCIVIVNAILWNWSWRMVWYCQFQFKTRGFEWWLLISHHLLHFELVRVDVFDLVAMLVDERLPLNQNTLFRRRSFWLNCQSLSEFIRRYLSFGDVCGCWFWFANNILADHLERFKHLCILV